ncbi:MAG: hypothetical protein HEQ40_15135 [Lacibacter sp.]|jgi:glucan phosphoethanolaminetransferase (alkaline phosphatase superfamily)
MELEVLKSAWKEVGSSAASTSPEELEQLLSKKSKSPIAKLKRNLFWELMVVVVMYGGTIIYYLLQNQTGMLYLALMMAVLGALYGWYYITKRKLLLNMECVTCEVKSNLSTQLVTLEKLLKLYLWAGTLLVPVILMVSGVIVYFTSPLPKDVPLSKEAFFIYFFIALFIISLVFTVPVFFLNKWYINLLYGRHVKKLRQIVNEMNELPFKN